MTPPLNAQAPLSFADLLGTLPIGPLTSDWLCVPQEDINAFGLLTQDPDPNHIDVEFAREHSPFGGPIAFGFQTLSLLTWLIKSAGALPHDATHIVNYGFDRLRFVSPVRAGAFIRGRFTVHTVTRKASRQILAAYGVEVDIQGEARVALAGTWLALYEGSVDV